MQHTQTCADPPTEALVVKHEDRREGRGSGESERVSLGGEREDYPLSRVRQSICVDILT